MSRKMQPGSFEFNQKNPRTRLTLTGPEITDILHWSTNLRLEHPDRWLHDSAKVEDKLLDALERITEQNPSTRVSLTSVDCASILGWADPSSLDESQHLLYEAIRSAQDQLPKRVPEQSKHLGNLPLFKGLDWATLGDVSRIGE